VRAQEEQRLRVRVRKLGINGRHVAW
jgi:hypothetical protein